MSPKLGGIVFSLIPFTAILLGAIGWWSKKKTAAADEMEGSASSSIEQLISCPRVVQSFAIGKRLLDRLERRAFQPLRKLGLYRALGNNLEQSVAFFVGFLTYSLAFWAGGIVVAEGVPTGKVLTVRERLSISTMRR